MCSSDEAMGKTSGRLYIYIFFYTSTYLVRLYTGGSPEVLQVKLQL